MVIRTHIYSRFISFDHLAIARRKEIQRRRRPHIDYMQIIFKVTPVITESMATNEQLFLKMTLDAWRTQVGRTTKLLNSLTDDELQREVAPGRNTGTYLLGHLTAIHDALFSLMRLGERLYTHYDEIFVHNPDYSGLLKPSPNELRAAWNRVNEDLDKYFSELNTAEWFQRHAAISESDFEKEPHRNRLNVVLNRTAHLANHLGQLTFLKPRG